MYVGMDHFGVKSKSKRGFEKGGMHIVITIELTTVMSSISSFHLELVSMFFHTNLIGEFKKFV
jgi:hypothetical protein